MKIGSHKDQQAKHISPDGCQRFRHIDSGRNGATGDSSNKDGLPLESRAPPIGRIAPARRSVFQATWDRRHGIRRTTRISAARESSAHRKKHLVFPSKRSRPSFDSWALTSALDSCQILRATSCCLQSCSVSAMIPSAHPSRLRSKSQPRARLFASRTLVFRWAMTACHSRARLLFLALARCRELRRRKAASCRTASFGKWRVLSTRATSTTLR